MMSYPELPTERTPLINGVSVTQSRENELPSIAEIEQDLYGQELLYSDSNLPSLQAILDKVNSYNLPSSETNHTLAILLCLRRIKFLNDDTPNGTQDPAAEYEAFVLGELGKLMKPDMDDELDKVLWTSFSLQKEKGSRQTVIDALFDLPSVGNKSWSTLTLSGGITRSLLRVWKRGLPPDITLRLDSSQQISLLSRMQRVATPRVLHLSELLFFIGYMAVFAHYILDPPHRSIFYPSPPPEWRTNVLMVYSASRIARDTWRRAVPSYLTLLSFLFALPSTPGPTDESYSFLIIAFTAYFVQLHLPLTPSPVFLNLLSRSTPLSVILISFVENIFGPVLSFFIPAFVITMFLLSISLSDVFLGIIATFHFDPAPVNARVGFFVLFSIIVVLFSCLLTSVLLISPSFEDTSALTWNTYGTKVGLQTRRYFLNAISVYSDPFFFPAPLNLLHLFLVRIPRRILIFLRRPTLASGWEGIVRATLWSMVVLPVAFAVGAAWAWGLAHNK